MELPRTVTERQSQPQKRLLKEYRLVLITKQKGEFV